MGDFYFFIKRCIAQCGECLMCLFYRFILSGCGHSDYGAKLKYK